jgi:WD40 repeat protein
VTPHPVRGTPQKSLISASADGLLKIWNLDKQLCVGSYGDSQMSKVNDFCLVAGLGLLVAASTDRTLRLFDIKIKQTSDSSGETGDV